MSLQYDDIRHTFYSMGAPAGLEAMFEELSITAERPELPPPPTGPPPPQVLARIDAVQRRLGIEMQQEQIFGH